MIAVPEVRGAVRWLALGRAGVAGALAAGMVGLALAGRLPFPLGPPLLLLAVAVLLSGGCLALLPRVRHAGPLAELQLYADVLLVTILIHWTGGPFSVFPFLYLLSILSASVVVVPPQSFSVATAAVLMHAGLLVASFYRWVAPAESFAVAPSVTVEGSLTILLVSANFCASFIVAYLATHLAGRLRQAHGDARRSERTLAELQAFHADIVQSVASGLLTVDRAGAVTSVNRTAEALFQRSDAAMRGAAWDTLFAGAPPFASVWTALERGGGRRTRFEVDLVRPDASTIPVGMSVSFLRRGLGVICSFQDLTDIKQMEERVRHADRLAAIGRLAAGLAHEIRNPMGSIRGSVEVLRESLNPTGEDRRLMDIVLRESDRLDAIIRDFLQFSRPPRLVRVPTDVAGMLDEILLMLSHHGGQGGAGERVRIVRDQGTATPVKAGVDPAQMRQALWNLCLNAVEAMPQGGELRVSVRATSAEAGALLEVTIRDTGVGIRADELPHVFEPFYTTKPQGTGLGLAIAHRIVKDHGGEIRVESEPGVGTVFTILIPVGEA